MEEEKILNVTQLGVVDKLQNEDVILLIRNTDNGKQCFQIKGFDFRGESAYEAALSQGFEGTYQDWVQQIKEVTEYDTKTLLSFKGIAFNDANKALTSGIYPNVTANIPITGETFTIQTLRTTTAVYNQYVSTQIALGVTGAAIGKVYIRKNTQKSGAYTFGDWIDLTADTNITDTIYKYVAQQVTDGAWIPVKAGRDKNGVIVDGAVAEGLNTRAIHRCSHAEGKNTVAAGYCSHAEGLNTETSGQGAHAEGENTKAVGVGSHAEGKGVEVLCWYGHGEGAYNYGKTSFIRTLGVGNSESNRVNAEAVYVKKSSDGNSLPIPSDPKNGYKYLLGIGGYTGKDITEGMKSIQEVISDLLSRIAILEAKKSKPKTQYIIGKAIPIGKLNGGARLNAYAVNGFLRFKLSRVPQLGRIISRKHTGNEVYALLNNVTWHVFIDGNEWKDVVVDTECNGDILRTNVKLNGFYMLDNTANNSGDLSSDMYIYLKTVTEGLQGVKVTSETLHYRNGQRIWEPFIGYPFIDNMFYIDLFSPKNIRLQKLYTRQQGSKFSGTNRSYFSYTNYRGRYDRRPIKRYGVYRYRIVRNGKKTQWHTINIMSADKDCTRFIIK